MMHFIESEDVHGMPTWDVYYECGHWGPQFWYSRVRFILLGIPTLKEHPVINMAVT